MQVEFWRVLWAMFVYNVDSFEHWYISQLSGSVELGTVKCCIKFWSSSHWECWPSFPAFSCVWNVSSTASAPIGFLVEEFVNYCVSGLMEFLLPWCMGHMEQFWASKCICLCKSELPVWHFLLLYMIDVQLVGQNWASVVIEIQLLGVILWI
jgi:hypothetical protein